LPLRGVVLTCKKEESLEMVLSSCLKPENGF